MIRIVLYINDENIVLSINIGSNFKTKYFFVIHVCVFSSPISNVSLKNEVVNYSNFSG